MQHSEIQTVHATVRGHVQGVGFRMFVWNSARRLDLQGYVRNQQDGSVYVVATGPRPALDGLIADIRRGPTTGHVAAVDVVWTQDRAEDDAPAYYVAGFEVRS